MMKARTKAVSTAISGILLTLLLYVIGCNPRMQAVPAIEMQPAPSMPEVPEPEANAAVVPEGYEVEVVVTDLTYPTSITFDETGTMYIAEAGYVYGDATAPARILAVREDGNMQVVAEGLSGPVNDLLWHEGQLYISHRGKISVLQEGGNVRDLVTGLPSLGDHQNNQLTVGPEGKIYFGQGTATNSGVVGLDNFVMGWLVLHPDFHDQPAEALELEGREYATPNPLVMLNEQGMEAAVTSSFHAFDDTGEQVPGAAKANGTILRMNPDGSELEVYAWGLRNPFGVMWGPGDSLYVAENGFDERGSRPIANAPDNLWTIEQGAWYGWPDYASGMPVTDPRFKPDYAEQPDFLMEEHPPVETPRMTIPEHSGVTKMAFSRSETFGHAGELFLAEFGDMTPMTGQVEGHSGYQVSRIDLETGQREPFFRVSEEAEGSEQFAYFATPGPKRPMGVQFSPDGEAMYVADLGAFTIIRAAGPVPVSVPNTGVIWRITPTGAEVEGPPAGLSADPGE